MDKRGIRMCVSLKRRMTDCFSEDAQKYTVRTAPCLKNVPPSTCDNLDTHGPIAIIFLAEMLLRK